MKISTKSEIWYRYEDQTYAGILRVELRAFVVLKHTKHGVWLALTFGDYFTTGDFINSEKRFVLNRSVKRFACPTVELAKISFITRKERQTSIYERRAKSAREAIHIINHKVGIY